MATNGWNLANFGRDQSRPYQTGSSSTMIACRVCDKILLSARSLLEHYESHHDDFAYQRQNQHPQGTNVWDFHRERSNPFQQQHPQESPHPYFPSGYRTTPSFHVSPQNPFFDPTQQVNYPRSNHLVTAGSSGRPSGANTSQLVINRPTETPGSLLRPPVRLEYQKGYDETGDKRTKWYLGQLERPIPKIVDQGNRNRSHSTSYQF